MKIQPCLNLIVFYRFIHVRTENFLKKTFFPSANNAKFFNNYWETREINMCVYFLFNGKMKIHLGHPFVYLP